MATVEELFTHAQKVALGVERTERIGRVIGRGSWCEECAVTTLTREFRRLTVAIDQAVDVFGNGGAVDFYDHVQSLGYGWNPGAKHALAAYDKAQGI
jgi:hypothetical protein